MNTGVISEDGVLRSEHQERRRGINPIPLNLREFLNYEQRRVLRQIEGFGWQLAFVRRPVFQDPVAVIRNTGATSYSVLEEDGTINANPDISVRD